MNPLKLIPIVMVAFLLAFSQGVAQKKGENSGVDPEFQKFWKEFVNILEKQPWRLSEVTYFPFIDVMNHESDVMAFSRNYFDIYFNLGKDVIQQIKKIKLSKDNVEIMYKDDQSFKYMLNEYQDDEFKYLTIDKQYIVREKDEYGNINQYVDYGKHIKNGTLIYKVSFLLIECYHELKFAKIDGKIFFVSRGIYCS